MPLLEARKQYKPFEYPWAFEYWKRQQQIHWMPEEVPLGPKREVETDQRHGGEGDEGDDTAHQLILRARTLMTRSRVTTCVFRAPTPNTTMPRK